MWLLQAAGQEEKDAWMAAVDPSHNTFELKKRVALAQQELEEKENEIHLLTSRLNETDDELKQKVTTLQSFCSSLTKKLELLKRQLIAEKDEGKRKDEEIRLLRELNQSMENEESEKVAEITKRLEAIQPILRTKEVVFPLSI